jgi:hypothetical protein
LAEGHSLISHKTSRALNFATTARLSTMRLEDTYCWCDAAFGVVMHCTQ